MQYEKISYEGHEYYFSGREDDPITQFHKKNRIFYEIESLDYLSSLLSKLSDNGATIIDAGANIGNHAVFFGSKFPGSKIVAFEMNPETYGYLSANAKENSLRNVIPVNFGLSNEVGRCGIRSVIDNPLGGAQLDLSSKEGEVSLTTIDAYFSETMNMPKVSLIKIDVEGHELQCLEGAKQLLEKDKPLIFLECKEPSEFSGVLNIHEPLGYQVMEASIGALPNFLFAHENSIDSLYSDIDLYEIRKDLCMRHVYSWQLHRDIKKLKNNIRDSAAVIGEHKNKIAYLRDKIKKDEGNS